VVHREKLERYGLHAGGCTTECPRGPTERWGRVWQGCPAAVLSDPLLVEVVETWAAARVSALDGWPSGWAAWVVEGVGAVERAWQRAQAEEASK